MAAVWAVHVFVLLVVIVIVFGVVFTRMSVVMVAVRSMYVHIIGDGGLFVICIAGHRCSSGKKLKGAWGTPVITTGAVTPTTIGWGAGEMWCEEIFYQLSR